MVVLVLAIMWLSGLAQTSIIRKMYYDQQAKQLTVQAEDIASVVSSGTDIKDKIKLLSSMNHANIMLVDREGYIEECHGMGMDMSMSSGRSISKKIGILGHHGDSMTRQELDRVLAGVSVAYRGHNNIINTEVLSVAVSVYSKDLVTGAVILSFPLTPYENQLANLQRVILGVGMGGIVLATLLSLFLSRSLSRPLIQMNNVARGLAAGDFSRKIQVRTKDEIGVLADSLNALSGQLQEKIKALDRLDNTRKDFVASISHELRTPLTVMQGYAEALQDNLAETEEERQECIDCIIDEIQRLKRLVGELLDLRRIETGQEKIDLKIFNILPIINKSMDKMSKMALLKGITMNGAISDEIPAVRSNPDRLEQVMINLLDNAIRHSPVGSEVEVAVESEENVVVIRIKDSGPGISEDDIDLIWEKFYKVDKSRTRTGGGTGRGLSIVRRIVENMGGNVSVDSTPGQGTTFNFTLPLAEQVQ